MPASNYSGKTYDKHLASQRKITVDALSISYIDEGEGSPLLLLHGLPTSSWLYRQMIVPLVENGFRVIAPDMVGYGASEKPKDLALYESSLQGNRILKFMDALGISHWTHVCHDAGGIWSWEQLLIDPGRWKALVILNTIIFADGFNPPMKFKEGSWMGKFYTGLYGHKLLGKFMVNATLINGACERDLSSAEKKGYWKPVLNGGSRAIRHFFFNIDEHTERLARYQDALSKLDIPVLVAWGKMDKILDGKSQAPQLKALGIVKQENIHLLERSKHFVQEDEPERLVELITAFCN